LIGKTVNQRQAQVEDYLCGHSTGDSPKRKKEFELLNGGKVPNAAVVSPVVERQRRFQRANEVLYRQNGDGEPFLCTLQ
jgi:hypothetical protein